MSNSSLVTYTKISPNKNSPRNHAIDTITIHCIVGQWTAKQGCDYFAQSNVGCAPNYVVGKDGSIGLSVEEKDRAWCTGYKDKKGNTIRVNGISGSDNDHSAITIEVASDTKHPYAVTEKAYNALIDLLVDICKRNGIKELKWEANKSLVGQVDKQNMTVHRWFAPKSCPGDYLYERHGQIAGAVNERLQEKKGNVVYKIQIGAYSQLKNAENALAKAKAAGYTDAFIVSTEVKQEAKPETKVEGKPEVKFNVGDKVKMEKNAPIYGSSKKFAFWVYSTTLYVRQVDGNRIVISTSKNGAVTGAVDKKYLTKK